MERDNNMSLTEKSARPPNAAKFIQHFLIDEMGELIGDKNMSEIALYKTPDNQITVEVQFQGKTFWLTREQTAKLFEQDRTVISWHLRNISKETELDERGVRAYSAHTIRTEN